MYIKALSAFLGEDILVDLLVVVDGGSGLKKIIKADPLTSKAN